jgi:hypothetical protein
MGRPEELEAAIGELEGELRTLLDEYVEVQQRLQTLEALTGCEGDLAADRTLADLPERVRRAARACEGAPSIPAASGGSAVATDSEAASQAEVAAAVERVEAAVGEEAAGERSGPDDGDDPDADGDATDIIVG